MGDNAFSPLQRDLHLTRNHKMETRMNNMLLKLYVKFQDLASREEGQDLVEYALVVALIAFGATAGMNALATGLNSAFSNISSTLGTYVS
jgi:pilus assembly protein Flp/PilA